MPNTSRSGRDVWHFLALCGVGFLVLASYSLARPPSESLFLAELGRDSLPMVWLAVALAAIVAVAVYNRFAATLALGTLFAAVSAVSAVLLAALLLVQPLAPAAAVFALYVWKDVYVVFLVELFWSYANTVFRLDSARWLYGLFLVAGTLGSLAGNSTVSMLSGTVLPSTLILWLVIPVLGAAAALFVVLTRLLPHDDMRRPRPAALLEGFEVVRGNRYLGLLIALICLAQVAITLVDYHYNGVLETTYPATDERTEVIARVYSAIDLSALAIQLLSGGILRLAGIGTILMTIPMFLAAALGAWMVVPRFATLVVAKVASKAFDYSIFRAAKELLYLPLTYREKTQGKAVVDILAYRVAKAATSVLLLGLIALGSQDVAVLLTFGIVAAWIGVTVALVRHYRAVQGAAQPRNVPPQKQDAAQPREGLGGAQ